MTVHDKTDHIVQKMILELRVPWPSMMFDKSKIVQVLFIGLAIALTPNANESYSENDNYTMHECWIDFGL